MAVSDPPTSRVGGADATAAAAAGRPARDLTLDVLRGAAMVIVVVNHIELPSLFNLGRRERLGVVSGADLFVLLSGVVLGMVHRRLSERRGWLASAKKLVRRAGQIYVVAVGVVVLVAAVAAVPGVDGSPVTTYTDRATGTVYPLYDFGGGALSQVRDVLVLRSGPGETNILSLYVVLLLIAPAAIWLMTRRLTPLLLVASAALWLLALPEPPRVLPAQSESPFPVLAWQLPFTIGVAVGFHRDALARRTALLRVGLAAAVLIVAAGIVFAWHNAYGPGPHPTIALLPGDVFGTAYRACCERRGMELGRLVDLLALVAVAYWLVERLRLTERLKLDRTLLPFGQATLYLFAVHVFFVLALVQFPALDRYGWPVGTLVHATVLCALLVMVRRRVLFRLIPR